jgi:hypothetical protein
VIGGGLVATYGIIEGSNRSANQVALAEEGNYLLRKVDWLLTGIDAGGILEPVSGSGATLKVKKIGITEPFILALDGTNLTLNRGANPPPIPVLNNSSVSITALNFERISNPGEPEAIRATFTLHSQIAGIQDDQDYTITKYLRQ